MTRYAIRTCAKCGIRKPQPEMVQKEIYVETGKSKQGISGSTLAGAFFGDKKSTSSVNRWFFNTNQRTYKRKKSVWACKSCAGKIRSGDQAGAGETIVGILFIIFVILLLGGFSG
jgi:hypothetical protein